MAFLTVSDASGEMEAVVFPEMYKKYSQLISSRQVCSNRRKSGGTRWKTSIYHSKSSAIETWLKQNKSRNLFYI